MEMQSFCKRSLTTAHLAALTASAMILVTGRLSAQSFVGGGNGPTFDTTPTVSTVADSGTRDPIVQLINGTGMLSKTADFDGSGNNASSIFTMFRNFPVG